MNDHEWKLRVKYSPDQPRVPAGGPGGGQWTSGTGWAGAQEVDADTFRAALQKNLPKRFEAFVTPYTPDEYREMGAKTVLLADGKTGYALKPDGDIISVFSGNGRGHAALRDALARGGKKLDCFCCKLPQIYAKYGFKEYERWKWDDQYAPKNWNYQLDDSPDVVLMRLEGR